ncbi:unnamed protein product, partial [Anisakis simplex]|uniref:Uncharacterized protein n=1 Tax=Anisakis simplex TaxID=6269 RepID=A0A0M3KC37_ANISI
MDNDELETSKDLSVTMIRRKDTPPVTQTTPEQHRVLLNYAKSANLSIAFSEEEEAEYEKQKEESQRKAEELYSPGTVPHIAIEPVEGQRLDKINESNSIQSLSCPIDHTDNMKGSGTNKIPVIPEENGRKEVIEADEAAYNAEIIKRMSRSNKWIPENEEDVNVRARRANFLARKESWERLNQNDAMRRDDQQSLRIARPVGNEYDKIIREYNRLERSKLLSRSTPDIVASIAERPSVLWSKSD